MCMPVIKKYYTGLRIATQKTISEMISLINNVSSFSLPNVSQIKIPAVGVEKGQENHWVGSTKSQEIEI